MDVSWHGFFFFFLPLRSQKEEAARGQHWGWGGTSGGDSGFFEPQCCVTQGRKLTLSGLFPVLLYRTVYAVFVQNKVRRPEIQRH